MVVGGTVVLSTVVLKHDGAREGSRTLNLGIKRRLTIFVWTCQGSTRRFDAFVPQSVLTCH